MHRPPFARASRNGVCMCVDQITIFESVSMRNTETEESPREREREKIERSKDRAEW